MSAPLQWASRPGLGITFSVRNGIRYQVVGPMPPLRPAHPHTRYLLRVAALRRDGTATYVGNLGFRTRDEAKRRADQLAQS